MEEKRISAQIQIEGNILTVPAVVGLGYKNGTPLIHGTLYAQDMDPKRLVEQMSTEGAAIFGPYIQRVCGQLPRQLIYHYENGQNLVYFSKESTKMGFVWQQGNMACLFQMKVDQEAKSGTLDFYITRVAEFFGIEQIYFYGRRGSSISPSLLTSLVMDTKEEFRYPFVLHTCDILCCGKLSYSKEKDLIGKFFYEVFGIENMKLSLMMGMGENAFQGYAMLPVLSGAVMTAEELYLGVVCTQNVSMGLAGSFRFSFLPEVIFHVDCAIGTEGFLLECFAEITEPVVIVSNFKMGDVALALGVTTKGMTFRMFANFYLGEIKLFGALGVSVIPPAVSPEFLSVAITDITLKKLVINLFGTNVAFADELDFLELSGLSLAAAENKTISVSKAADVKEDAVKQEIVSQFNGIVNSPLFAVQPESAYIERIQGVTQEDGIILTDKSRMRHYYIHGNGKLSLQAQLYISMVDTKLGDYTLRKGTFVCGSITLFQKFSIKALFSMSESDGVIAYASIAPIRLGILGIEESGIQTEDNPLTYFPKDSLLWLLMDENPKGAVFFLRAGKNDCSFYIDGRISFYGFYKVAARVLYSKKTVSIDVRWKLANLVYMNFQLHASYQSISDENFKVVFILDCTGLEKAMKKAQAGVEKAIQRLREKIGGAQEKLTQAQQHVNELHSQIDTLNRRIQDCKNVISRAKWWKKAFVAIAKGVEIAAYEVAKAALYVSIGVANAALEVAKQVVGIAGVIGEGILQIVNGAITAALNLFFIKYIHLEAEASMKSQSLLAEMEFVALGKTFHIKKELGAQSFFNNPGNTIDDSVSNKLQPELDNIENGSFKSNRRRYKKMNASMKDYQKMLVQGMEQLNAGKELLKGMADSYNRHCGEMLPEYDQFHQNYLHALDEVEGAMALAEQSVDYQKMDELVEQVQSVMKDPTKKVRANKQESIRQALSEYEKAAQTVKQLRQDMQIVREQKQEIQIHFEERKATQNQEQKEKTATIPSKVMENVLNDTEECLYSHFPVTKMRGTLIHLGREEKIRASLDQVRKELDLRQSNTVQKARNKRTPLKYESRL